MYIKTQHIALFLKKIQISGQEGGHIFTQAIIIEVSNVRFPGSLLGNNLKLQILLIFMNIISLDFSRFQLFVQQFYQLSDIIIFDLHLITLLYLLEIVNTENEDF